MRVMRVRASPLFESPPEPRDDARRSERRSPYGAHVCTLGSGLAHVARCSCARGRTFAASPEVWSVCSARAWLLLYDASARVRGVTCVLAGE